MTFFLHLRRNIARNPGRTTGVVLVVGLTLAIFLVLGQVSTAIDGYTGQVVASVPNILVVQPAGGSLGAAGNVIVAPGSPGYATLTPSVIEQITATANVQSVQRVSISSPALGGSGGAPGKSSCSDGNSVLAEDTTSAVKIVGANQVSGATTPNITSGRSLESADENGTNVIVGQQYASDNNVGVGSSLPMFGQEFTVVGIFSGNGCDGDTVVVPYPIAAHLLDIAAPIFVYVYVSSYNDVATVFNSLQSSLGSSYSVEDLATADHSSLQNSISSILLVSEFGEFAALVAGAAVMVVVTMLVTSRRIREIGILKALGYGSATILGQITVESLILTLVGFPLALGLSVVVGPLIAQGMLGSIGATSSTPPPVGANAKAVSGGAVNPFLQNVHFALTPETVTLGLAIAIAFGVLAASYPALRAIRLRPMEALRHE
jgi:ABC-type antimicrobial peptide transport system permease subunit